MKVSAATALIAPLAARFLAVILTAESVMFLLNNIHNRPYKNIYPELSGVIFDISDLQLRNSKNQDWHKICEGSVVCVVTESRKISTFYMVDVNVASRVLSPESGMHFVLIGKVLAKLHPAEDMTSVLNRYKFKHPFLPNNKFSNGFNVADLGSSLDGLELCTASGVVALGELKSGKLAKG